MYAELPMIHEQLKEDTKRRRYIQTVIHVFMYRLLDLRNAESVVNLVACGTGSMGCCEGAQNRQH